jgi:DNA-binding LacI/PurR family transcriptional regulator
MTRVRAISTGSVASDTVIAPVADLDALTEGLSKRVQSAKSAAKRIAAAPRRKSNSIAFVYTGESGLGNPFEGSVVCGMSREMHNRGYDLLLLDARRAKVPEETYSSMFARKGVRGAILRTTPATRHVCEIIAEENFPAVVVGDRFENPKVSCVYSDFGPVIREAVEHLISLGHRKIALGLSAVSDTDWEVGYRQALKANNIEVEPDLIYRVPAGRDSGAQLLRRLIAVPDRSTAVLLTEPLTSVGLLDEARRYGVRVPEELSVVGVDDSQHCFGLMPELTAICQDGSAVGREALVALHSMLTSEGHPPVKNVMRPWLEVHRSTGPAPV